MLEKGKKPIKTAIEKGSKKPIKIRKKSNLKYKYFVLSIIFIAVIFVIIMGIQFLLTPSLEKIKDSVVMIEAYNESGEKISTGSGFSAYKDNYIATNFHVIEGASSLKVITDDKKEYDVNKIIIFNKQNDLAIIRINGSLNPLQLGNGNNLKVKNKVTAIGSPKGELNTVSEGVISNIDDEKMIRISVPISHGSSGGVLLNNRNQVIGITSAGYDDAQNLNFAININKLKNLKKDLDIKKYAEINNTNYKNCAPNIINYNTANELSIKKKCSFSNNNSYTASDMNSFYMATNSFEIFNTAMYKLGIDGMNVNYKKLSKADQVKASEYYTNLLKYETCGDNSLTTGCKLSGNIESWAKEQFIMELDILQTYALAIFEVEINNNTYSQKALVSYIDSLNITYEDKLLLNRLMNPSDNRYNKEIINYISSKENISKSEVIEILRYLDMAVDSNGNVRW